MLFWKLLVSLFVALLAFEGLVTAFHLLNMPSDLAVLGGVCLLLLIAAGGFIVLRFTWRKL